MTSISASTANTTKMELNKQGINENAGPNTASVAKPAAQNAQAATIQTNTIFAYKDKEPAQKTDNTNPAMTLNPSDAILQNNKVDASTQRLTVENSQIYNSQKIRQNNIWDTGKQISAQNPEKILLSMKGGTGKLQENDKKYNPLTEPYETDAEGFEVLS